MFLFLLPRRAENNDDKLLHRRVWCVYRLVRRAHIGLHRREYAYRGVYGYSVSNILYDRPAQ